MRDLASPQDLDAVLGASEAVLLKHGAHCPISAAARDEVARFEAEHPDVTVHGLEVTGNRDLSEAAAERLGTAHASPQLFVLRQGKPAYTASHFEIRAETLAAQLGGAAGGR
jgi:bacillithiol system protein YtxJ